MTKSKTVDHSYAVADPDAPANVIKPNADGSINVVGVNGGTTAVTQSTNPWIVAGGGTAGTAATGVVTVQGIASGTALAGNITQTGGNVLTADTVAAGTTVPLPVGGRAAVATLPTYTDGNRAQTQFDASGNLNVKMRGTLVAGSDGLSNTNLVGPMSSALTAEGLLRPFTIVPFLFNAQGTWDRQRVGPYQVSQTPLAAGSGNVTNAAAAATLTGTAATTVYISGFEVTGSGATAGLPVTVTVTGLLGGTRSYTYTFTTGALLANQPLIVAYNPPLPASAVNTAIVVSCPASGAGGTNNTTVAHGYYQ